MARADRAKLFAPFDALKGLQDILREKEIEIEERKELTEESLAELERTLNNVDIGCKVTIRFYKDEHYINIYGIITDIDYIKKKIVINKDERINISDIINIKL